jgi:hypothetical protein
LRFLTASTVFSGDGSRACCIPMPALGFVVRSVGAEAPRSRDDAFLRRFAPRRQPCRLATTAAPPTFTDRPSRVDGSSGRRSITRSYRASPPSPFRPPDRRPRRFRRMRRSCFTCSRFRARWLPGS